MPSTGKQDKSSVPGAHRQNKQCCTLLCIRMQHRQLTTAPRAGQHLPSASPEDVRYQPCKEPRTVSALIPTSWSCTLGSVSAENTTEQTVSWSDSRALSSGGRSMESLPASHCHSTATTTALDRHFLMPRQFTSNHTKSLGQAAHTATQVNELFFSQHKGRQCSA